MSNNDYFTLLEAPMGTYIVERINAGRKANTRLSALGVLPGTEVEKQNYSTNNPVMLDIKNRGRIALGRGLSEKIIVKVKL
jgi:Fe2+ transport system protein FeoA